MHTSNANRPFVDLLCIRTAIHVHATYLAYETRWKCNAGNEATPKSFSEAKGSFYAIVSRIPFSNDNKISVAPTRRFLPFPSPFHVLISYNAMFREETHLELQPTTSLLSETSLCLQDAVSKGVPDPTAGEIFISAESKIRSSLSLM